MRGRGGLGAGQFAKKNPLKQQQPLKRNRTIGAMVEKTRSGSSYSLVSRLIFDVKNNSILAQAIAQPRSEIA